MKKVNGKSRLLIGCAALIVAGVLVSYFLLRYQKDWIMLAGIIVFGILFLKCFKDEELEKYIYDRMSKYINILSVILIAVAVTLLPDSAATMINEKYQGIAYFLSFLCWFMGAYFQSIKSEQKVTKT